MNSYSQMPLRYLDSQFATWSRYLTSHQTCNIFFLKNTGIIPRILQFIDYHQSNEKVKPVVLDLEALNATDPHNLQSVLSVPNSKPTIIIVRDLFLLPGANRLEKVLEQYYVSAKSGMLIIHECAPHELYINYERASCLYVHPLLFRLPTEKSIIKDYIHSTCKLWKIALDPAIVDDILSYSGNIPWLLNESIRLCSENPKLKFSEISKLPSLSSRVMSFYSTLPSLYKAQIGSNSMVDQALKDELISFGLMQSDQLIGTHFIDSIRNNKLEQLRTTPAKILLNSIDISAFFSSSEKRLINLLNTTSKTVLTRDEVANTFYNNEEPYSDWALSQVITRLRTKLARHKIPLSITTKRGFGYGISR